MGSGHWSTSRGTAARSSRGTAHIFKGWPQLAEEIAHSVRAQSAILDGEIVCLDPDGRSSFKNLLFRREWPPFVAFDGFALGGKDLRPLPLIDRKRRLASIMRRIESRLLLMDHIEERGIDLFRAACEHDLEGIVGKWRDGSYSTDPRATSWVKVKNPTYSQMEGRYERFEVRQQWNRRRATQGALSLVLQCSSPASK
jgi:ATP-dependent DNA ligase